MASRALIRSNWSLQYILEKFEIFDLPNFQYDKRVKFQHDQEGVEFSSSLAYTKAVSTQDLGPF